MKKHNLLLKKIAFKLNEDEEIQFQEWLQKSDKNKLLFEKLSLLKKNKHLFNSVSKLDENAAWKLIQEKSKQKKSSKKLFNRSILKFTVAASIVLFISISFIYNINVSDPESNASSTIVNNIKSGTHKAILTLDDGTHIELDKDVEYKTPSINSNGKQITYLANEKQNTEVKYNYLTIPRGGQFYIKLSDGTQVWLNSETKIKYPVTFTEGINRQIELIYGEAYFDVSPSTEHKGATFEVYHNKQIVNVLGTEFNIKAYRDETNIYTTLVEGKVTIEVNSKKRYLKPNQQSTLNLENNSLTISTIDVSPEIMWKEGVFNFDSKVLKDIMIVLARWYDIEVVFKNKELEKQKFTGLIKKHYNIEEILEVMKETNIISSYSINDKTIILK